MAASPIADATTAHRIRSVALALIAVALVLAVALLVLHDGPDLLQGAIRDDVGAPGDDYDGPHPDGYQYGPEQTDSAYSGELGALITRIDAIRGPLTVAFSSMVSVGLLAGGVAMASGFGSQMGIKLITTSALAGAATLLGNGVVE